MISIADFLKQVNWRMCETLMQRLKLLLRRQSKVLVREVMSTPAITVSADTPLTKVFMIFAEHGINHLPVVDGDNRLAGIVTRLDLLAALYGNRTGSGQSPNRPPESL
jgi:CBS domain-containing membrane protein